MTEAIKKETTNEECTITCENCKHYVRYGSIEEYTGRCCLEGVDTNRTNSCKFGETK